MKLYRWASNYFGDWAAGDIVVMAESVEAARALAIAKWEAGSGKDLRDAYEEEPEDNDYYKQKIATFFADIAKEPRVIEGGVIFIYGSA
jgi:hypothetical protein